MIDLLSQDSTKLVLYKYSVQTRGVATIISGVAGVVAKVIHAAGAVSNVGVDLVGKAGLEVKAVGHFGINGAVVIAGE